MISIPCPSCGQSIKAPDEAAGKTGKCNCGELVRIPTPNSFEQARQEGRSPRAGPVPPEPQPAQSPIPYASPAPAPPLGDLIFCYACRKQVADNAPTCPRCGAVQTPEGREKRRRFNKQTNIITTVLVCVLALPIVTCCVVKSFPDRANAILQKQKSRSERVMKEAAALMTQGKEKKSDIMELYQQRLSEIADQRRNLDGLNSEDRQRVDRALEFDETTTRGLLRELESW